MLGNKPESSGRTATALNLWASPSTPLGYFRMYTRWIGRTRSKLSLNSTPPCEYPSIFRELSGAALGWRANESEQVEGFYKTALVGESGHLEEQCEAKRNNTGRKQRWYECQWFWPHNGSCPAVARKASSWGGSPQCPQCLPHTWQVSPETDSNACVSFHPFWDLEM